jgi:uncharacterized membrane protein YkoI
MSHASQSFSFGKILSSAFLCTALIGAASLAQAYTGEELAKDAKINLVDARAIALKAHPGKVTDEELEKEKGGSGLRYSFDIKNAKTTYEIGVDAQSGAVLENAAEGKNPD